MGGSGGSSIPVAMASPPSALPAPMVPKVKPEHVGQPAPKDPQATPGPAEPAELALTALKVPLDLLALPALKVPLDLLALPALPVLVAQKVTMVQACWPL